MAYRHGHWGRPGNMTPLEAGGGGGGPARGYRPVAPQRLFPDTTRPPHGAPESRASGNRGYDRPTPPMNRGYPIEPPKGKPGVGRFPWWLFGWEPGDLFMLPESPATFGPAGYVVPAGWTQCATPDCPGTVTHWWWSYTNGTCAALAPCPPGQAFPTNWPAGTEPAIIPPFFPARDNLIWVEETSPGVGTLRAQFVRPPNQWETGPLPSYETGRVILPDAFGFPGDEASPFPAFAPEKYYGDNMAGTLGATGSLVGSRPGSGPGVGPGPGPGGGPVEPPGPPRPPMMEFGPGGGRGRPGLHEPAPPRPGDKERKEPPFNYGLPGKVYGGLTEAGDAAACYIQAKGGEAKGGTRSKLKQAWAMANDPDAPPLDGPAFMACLAQANAQDAVIGGLSGGAARTQNRSPYAPKRPGGYRGGGWGTRMT